MKLDNPRSAIVAAANGRGVQVAEANAFAGNIMAIVETVGSSGITDLRGIAEARSTPRCGPPAVAAGIYRALLT